MFNFFVRKIKEYLNGFKRFYSNDSLASELRNLTLKVLNLHRYKMHNILFFSDINFPMKNNQITDLKRRNVNLLIYKG